MLVSKKAVPLHPHFRNAPQVLGYGVMVTLQILVLPFLVRVRVPQQENPLSHWSSELSGFFFISLSAFVASLRFIHIVAWRHSVELLEDGREGGRIIEPAGIHDLGNVHIM